VLSICRDATQRNDVQSRLQASEKRFRAVADSMLESPALFAAVRNGNGEIVEWGVEYVNDALDRDRAR
jgi:PAS domain-containing protein